MPEAQPREIQRYTAPDNRVPFEEWFEALKDVNAQAKIISRLNRITDGNLGDYRSVGKAYGNSKSIMALAIESILDK
jgi:hypothetical protein